MSKAETVRQILRDNDPTLNVNPGSGIEGLVINPSAEVFDVIQGEVDTLRNDAALISATTAERKDDLLTNFGLVRRQGNQASGTLKITVSPAVGSYSFPTGTTFIEPETGTEVQTTSDLIITSAQSTEAEVSVVTVENTSQVFAVGTLFDNTLFGNLVLSSQVSQQIGGGTDVETDDELTSRIIEDLSENGLTVTSLRTKVLKQFPTLLDARVERFHLISRSTIGARPSGIKADIFIKSTLAQKTVTVVDNNTVVIKDSISEIVSASRTILSRTVRNQGTAYEENTLVLSDSSFTDNVTITYLSPTLLVDVQSYLDDEDVTPIGVDLVAVTGTPIFVSSADVIIDSTYILQHPLENFSVSKLITDTGLTDFELPIEVVLQNGYTGETKIITNKDDSFYPAYYAR